MKKTIAWIVCVIAVIAPGAAVAASVGDDDNKHQLTIAVDGFELDSGTIGVNLFSRQDQMFEHPMRVLFANIEKGKAVLVIDDLALGDYAVVAYHDKNNNGKLDHHFLGYPVETIAYSGDFHFGLFSGMPSFNKLKFRYHQARQSLRIQIDN